MNNIILKLALLSQKMLNSLPIDILSYINTFNYVTDQKVLKCVSNNFRVVKTGKYIDEVEKYSVNYSNMNIAHKENPAYYSIADTKDKYDNYYGLLKNIWWFGVNALFNVKKDKYIIIFDIDLPIVSVNYEVKLTLSGKEIKIKKKSFKDACIIVDIIDEGELLVELDEHNTHKNKIIIKKIICVPYYIVTRNTIKNLNNLIPNKYFSEIFQLCECPEKYLLIEGEL